MPLTDLLNAAPVPIPSDLGLGDPDSRRAFSSQLDRHGELNTNHGGIAGARRVELRHSDRELWVGKDLGAGDSGASALGRVPRRIDVGMSLEHLCDVAREIPGVP